MEAKMTRDQAQKLCERWLPLWTGNRPEELAAVYSDDVFYRDPAVPQGLRGKAALLAYLRKLLAVNPDWRWYAVELFETPGGFTGKWRAEIPVKGQIVEEFGVDIVEVDDAGLIRRNEVYFDRAALLKVLGK
jgi:hypothetical protein